MPSLVISYRKQDAGTLVDQLRTSLASSLSSSQVYMGVDSLAEPGDDILEAIEQGIKSCQLLLVAIGPMWLSDRWVDNPQDLDRRALEIAIREKKRIIPVLLNNAPLPAPEALPESISALVRRTPLSVTEASVGATVSQIAAAFSKAAEAAPTGPAATAPQPPAYSSPAMPASPMIAAKDPLIAAADAYNMGNLAEKPKRGQPSGSSGAATLYLPEAIPYPFNDSEWIKKAAIGVLINLVPLIGQIIALGYGVRLSRQVAAGDTSRLPEWDSWGSDAGTGFGLLAASILYSLLFLLVVWIPCIGQLLLLLLVPIIALATVNYVNKDTFGAFFDFNWIIQTLQTRTNEAVMLIIDVMLLSIALGIVVPIGLGLFVLPGLLLSVLGMFVYSYLIGRWAQRFS
jgi:hypothetical protein